MGWAAIMIIVAIIIGKPSKMMNSNSSWIRSPLIPSDNSATLKADRPIIKRMAIIIQMANV